MRASATPAAGARREGDAPAARPPAAIARLSERRQGTRDRLFTAAIDRFRADSYHAVSVEEIAAAAGVSRMTFYRHFSGKAALAAELFSEVSAAAIPHYVAIGQRDFRDGAVVVQWITGLFRADRASSHMLRIFTQANADEAEFTAQAQRLISDLIAGLGDHIPAFAIDRDDPAQRRRWLEAWLLLYEILDQSNHAALNSGVATDPLVVDILADRFGAFVRAGD